MMVRKTLEEICADQQADGPNLQKRLEAFPELVLTDVQVAHAVEMSEAGASLPEAGAALDAPMAGLERYPAEYQPRWRRFLREREAGDWTRSPRRRLLLSERDKRWVATLPLGDSAGSGKRIRKAFSGATQREALSARKQFVCDLEEGLSAQNTSVSVGANSLPRLSRARSSAASTPPTRCATSTSRPAG